MSYSAGETERNRRLRRRWQWVRPRTAQSV